MINISLARHWAQSATNQNGLRVVDKEVEVQLYHALIKPLIQTMHDHAHYRVWQQLQEDETQ